jgi:ParB family chromosome partitioning protein
VPARASRRVERVADPHLRERAGQGLQELVVPAPGHHDPGQRGADLSGQEALGRSQGPRGGRDVHVVQDHRGRLAAQFQRAAGDPLAADRGDPPPGGGRTGEGDLVHPRVADQQLGDLPVGGHHVEHARRQAGRLGRLGDQVSLAGGLGRGLQDDRAPGQQGGRDLVADQRHRRVPRDDRADHADRLADEQAELPGLRLGRLLERERGGHVGERVKGHLRAGPAEAGDGVQHAGFARPDLAEVVAPPGELGTDGAQDPGPFGMSQPRPGATVERLPRGLDRPGYVGRLRLRHAEEELLGPGVDHLDRGVGRGLYPLPADEEAIRVPDRGLNVVGQAHLIPPISGCLIVTTEVDRLGRGRQGAQFRYLVSL